MAISGSALTSSEHAIRCRYIWIQPDGWAGTESTGTPDEFRIYTNLRAEDINRRDKREGVVNFRDTPSALKWAKVIRRNMGPDQ